MNVLGIESSCDETSVAVISDGVLKANLVSSQDFHSKYGGVVPELSSRAHLQIVIPLLRDALKKTGLKLADFDLISATAGPGLIGALLVGLTLAKGLAYSLNKPFIAVNHIEGHIFSGFLMEDQPVFPCLVLVVSGGHTLLLRVESYTKIIKLGSTVDDAAGEAFDKVAKMMGLGYPGGPAIQKIASNGNPDKINFPIADLKLPFDFSFSGLKTSVLRYIQKKYGTDSIIPKDDLPDIAASFQRAVLKALINNVERAINKFDFNSLSLTGGVAANLSLRKEFERVAAKYDKKLVIPHIQYCGDNAAMIALRAEQLFRSGVTSSLDAAPYPGLPVNYFS